MQNSRNKERDSWENLSGHREFAGRIDKELLHEKLAHAIPMVLKHNQRTAVA
ncbi:hypothetical protein [Blastopirellula marina]|uniref:Uncharacterized protein n=1 Tax=Blastopirellula marina DSM 3645 TaxID=314230 RepID=A3ZMJ0_9BACT|nr:hypothetical protein [Blastopirellula marina]EAQ82163.1 hypothetical protein DSM3645_00575 [Blastopirellula marina DSM 3645]